MELERFVAESIGADRRPLCHVVEGDPPAEILKAARRLGSDLIVMGTHGLTGFDRLFFGSTTDRVLRGVTVPLMVVPPPDGAVKPRRPRRAPDRSRRLRRDGPRFGVRRPPRSEEPPGSIRKSRRGTESSGLSTSPETA